MRQLEEATRPRLVGRRRRGRAPGTGLLRQPEARRTIGIRPSGIPRDGAQPHWDGGRISGAVPGGPAVRVTGPALEEQIGDARAGRDVRRGFVNARPDSHFGRTGRRQPATAAGQTGRGGRRRGFAQTRRKPATAGRAARRPPGEERAPGPSPCTAGGSDAGGPRVKLCSLHAGPPCEPRTGLFPSS
jgi:hypothetical protein